MQTAEPTGRFLIRRAGASDADELARFAARTFSEAFGAENTPEDLALYLARAYGPAQQGAELRDPTWTTLLAEEGKSPAGYAQVRTGPAPSCVTGQAPIELFRFYVDSPWQGQGLARRLMAAVDEGVGRAQPSHHLGALTTMRGQASDLGSNWFVTRNLNFTRDYFEALQKVTLEDMQSVARRYLIEDNLTVVSLNPRGTLAPKAAEAIAVSAGEVEKFELSNGLRLLVREDPRLPLVSMVATFRGGLLADRLRFRGQTFCFPQVWNRLFIFSNIHQPHACRAHRIDSLDQILQARILTDIQAP